MSKRVGAMMAAVLTVPAIAVTIAGPAAAAEEESWSMPDFRGMSLKGAVDEVASVTDNSPLSLQVFNTTGAPQKITNPTNWIVCYQRPSPDAEITLDSNLVLGLRRPNTECWG